MPLGGRVQRDQRPRRGDHGGGDRDVGIEAIVDGLASVEPVPGRFERVTGRRRAPPIDVIVDYAHTPDGLEEVIAAAGGARRRRGRVIVVFGAGGDRDRPKRPEMGATAARLADLVVVTSDNPRSEDPADIIDDILAGIPDDDRRRVEVEIDRAAAIELAITMAEPGDVVSSPARATRPPRRSATDVLPFDDRDVARRGPRQGGRAMIAVMIAGVVAGIVSLFVTRALISLFRTRGLGQPILGKEDRGPEHHMAKQGTPTMGGIAILVAALVGWMAAHVREGLPFSTQALIVWVGILAMALMGFLDDFIKVRRRHNRGIFWKQKNYVTLLMSFGIAWWLVYATGIAETISLTRADYPGWEVPSWVWVIFAGLDHLGDDQRRQRHRRPRRARRRLGADGLRRVHDHRLHRLPLPGDLRRRRQPARPHRARRRVRRRVPGLPVVQRRAGADHHGRRRRARPRLGAGDARPDDEHAAAARC